MDLAIGCTYKYLNGGPGAPAFLFVRQDLQERLSNPIWRWFGRKGEFEMGLDYIRLGIAPLYTSFADIYEGMARLRRVMVDRLYEKYPSERPEVT